ncbi:unnamed protein product [Urochloa humidicola]
MRVNSLEVLLQLNARFVRYILRLAPITVGPYASSPSSNRSPNPSSRRCEHHRCAGRPPSTSPALRPSTSKSSLQEGEDYCRTNAYPASFCICQGPLIIRCSSYFDQTR